VTFLEPSVRVEAPPPGLASGRFDVPRWAIATLGAIVIAIGVGYVVVRVLRARRAR
jgi:hypothetical protein